MFSQQWKLANRNIFRLERLPIYRVPGDWERFDKFRKGQRYSLDKEDAEWIAGIKQKRRLGVKIKRVRVFAKPLSDYLRYEIDYWKRTRKAGEQILFISEKDYLKTIKTSNLPAKDFWLFDEKALVIFNYDKKGGWIGENTVNNEKTIAKYADLARAILNKASPSPR